MSTNYTPEMLPFHIADDKKISILKKERNTLKQIERFNVLMERSVIKEQLLMMFSMNESVQSTKIEGTQVTFTDMMEYQSDGQTNNDRKEVTQYFEALKYGEIILKQGYPITTRVFHKLHEILLDGTRGQNKAPGQFKKNDVFLGTDGKRENASYVPPQSNLIPEYIANLEKYINSTEDELDDFGYLSRSAIIHAQFETIHPYLDGNGRLGRILIVLYLLNTKIINGVNFFISEELEENKYKYYNLLNGVRLKEPKWFDWIDYFLNSALNQADKYINKLEKIENLYSKFERHALEHKINIYFVKFLFKMPVFAIKDVTKELNISDNTARKYVNSFVENNMIYPDNKSRNKKYYNYDIINIVSK